MGAEYDAMRDTTQARRPIDERFPDVVCMNTELGKQPHVLGTGMQVWQIIVMFKGLGESVDAVADYYGFESELVRETVAFWRSSPEEIDRAIAEYEAALDEIERHRASSA